MNNVMAIFQGSLSDLKGRNTILMLTLLLCSVTYTVSGITTSLTIILVSRAILGNSHYFQPFIAYKKPRVPIKYIC